MTQPPNISPAIADLLSRLRKKIRAYVWLEGCAGVIAAAGVAFWLVLAVDWVFEPSPMVRKVLFALVGLGLFVLLYKFVLARAFARLSDISLALLLERQGQSFDDSLLTAVELAAGKTDTLPLEAEMLEHTTALAARRAKEVRLSEVFNYRPLQRRVFAALLLLISIGGFAYFSRDAFIFYVERLSLSTEHWPRTTRLVVAGFPEDEQGVRRIKVAKGGSLTLVVQADNGSKFEIPQRVEVLYTLDDGSRGRGDAKKIGNAVPGLDKFQEFQFEFENLHDSHTFDVVGRAAGVLFGLRDERIRGLRLEVVDSPGVYQKSLEIVYPKYMQKSPATIDATAAMQLPRGAQIKIQALANKPLVRVRVDDSALAEPVSFEIPATQADRRAFSYEIPSLEADRVLFFSLTDEDGITTAEQNRDRLSILALPDEPPQVTVRLQGIGEAITPVASIPLSGKVKDDYGVGELAFEHRVGETIGTTPLAAPPRGRQELDISEALDARPLNLQPKQILALWLKAKDSHALEGGPQEGSSTRFELQVVTPEDLRGLLDRDELRLRQRFEAVYEEMTRTRDLLARIDFNSPSEEKPAATDAAEENAAPATNDPADKPANPDPAAQPKAAEPQESPQEALERTAARRRLQLMKGLHYIERAGHDVLSIATGFDEIYAQMINNRIDSEDARQRLVKDIAEPLKAIGGPQLKSLAERLEQLRTLPVEDPSGAVKLPEALAAADEVLVKMKQVLDRMQELGDFNELVEMLRGILKDQDQIISETKKQRAATTRSLLED